MEVLVEDLSREVGDRVQGRLSARGRMLVLEIRYRPRDNVYLNEGECLMEMRELMEMAAIRYTGFADEVAVSAVPSAGVLLVGDVPEIRRCSQTVAELRRRFDRKQILESGDRLWPKRDGLAYRRWRFVVLHHSGACAQPID